MGRKLMRVPLDFDWPMGETWKGYVNPHYVQCEKCRGSGEDGARLFVKKIIRLLVLGAEESQYNEDQIAQMRDANRRLYPHPYLQSEGIEARNRAAFGSEGLLMDFVARLSGKDKDVLLGPFGINESARHGILCELLSAAGLPMDWGYCSACKGEGIEPEYVERYEAWRETEPPVGDGYQLWETTSEGSPISPVFQSLALLCAWCADNATVFGSHRASAERWHEMLTAGHVYHKEGSAVFM